MTRLASALSVALVAAACSGPPRKPLDPATAPHAVIDRFNDNSGTLFTRSGDPNHPGPNEPIPLDTRFLKQGLGPNGEIVKWYHLDVKPTKPAPMYVLVDSAGNPVPDQLPIVDLLPDSDGYNDYWRIYHVQVPAGYVANTIASLQEIKDAGLAPQQTKTIVNRPLVPQGTQASLRLDPSQPTAPQPAWYRDEVAFYLVFGTGTVDAADVPVADKYVTYKSNTRGAASNAKTEADGVQTHNVVSFLPKPGALSPLLHVIVYDNTYFDSVHDLASAKQAKVLNPDEWIVNNPIVSIQP